MFAWIAKHFVKHWSSEWLNFDLFRCGFLVNMEVWKVHGDVPFHFRVYFQVALLHVRFQGRRTCFYGKTLEHLQFWNPSVCLHVLPGCQETFFNTGYSKWWTGCWCWWWWWWQGHGIPQTLVGKQPRTKLPSLLLENESGWIIQIHKNAGGLFLVFSFQLLGRERPGCRRGW